MEPNQNRLRAQHEGCDLPYPEGAERFYLRDGAMLTIRAIQPDDASRLQNLLSRLSQQSIYHRFLAIRSRLRDSEARALSCLDYETKMALVATRDLHDEETVVAVARYVVITHERPELAEIAVVVEDPYQDQGLGTFLCDRLRAYALAHGIKAFHADVHSTNTRMLHLIRQIGPVTSRRMDAGVVEITVDLEAGREPEVPNAPLQSNLSRPE